MQINPNSSSAPIGAADAAAAKTAKRATTEVDSAAFSHVDELEKSMRDQADTRPEVVQKAAELTNQPQWPPTETIRRIANLLAISMGRSSE